MREPVVVEVVEVREVPLDEPASRALVVRWSDGSVSEAARFWADELLVSEGDLVGRTRGEIRGLLHARDLQFLRDGEPPDPAEAPFFKPDSDDC